MRSRSTLIATLTLCAAACLTTACDEKPTIQSEANAAATEVLKDVEKKTDEAKTGAAAKPDDAAAQKKEAPDTEGALATVGQPAPEFTLKDQDGKEHKLSDYKGKIVVLEWTNPTCPYVIRHYKANTMSKTHTTSDPAQVVWLALDSSHFVKPADAQAWRKDSGFEYPVLLDADGKIGRAYQAKTTPHMFVVDQKGVLRYSGAIDDNKAGTKTEGITNYVSGAVEALKAGKDVETPQTQPYGCSVKYGS